MRFSCVFALALLCAVAAAEPAAEPASELAAAGAADAPQLRGANVPLDWIDAELAMDDGVAATDLSEATSAGRRRRWSLRRRRFGDSRRRRTHYERRRRRTHYDRRRRRRTNYDRRRRRRTHYERRRRCKQGKYVYTSGNGHCANCQSNKYRAPAWIRDRYGRMSETSHSHTSCDTQTTCDKGKYISSDSKTAARSCYNCPNAKYRDTDGHRNTACVAQRYCGYGHKLDDSKTALGSCSACEDNKYRDSSRHQYTTCKAQRTCNKGKFLGNASKGAKGTCYNCQANKYHDTDVHRFSSCTTQTTCDKGEKISDDSKTAARTCSNCGANTYRDSDGHRETACVAQPTCAAGKKMSADSKTAARTCSNCGANTFKTGDNRGTSCTAWTTCTLDHPEEYETKAGTATSDRVCGSHTTCTTDQFVSKAATTTSNRECTGRGSCENGSLIAAASATQANHCRTCNNGYTLSGKACRKNCVVGTFGAWSTCTKSCGTGSQKRSRTLEEPQTGGVACPHSAETQACNEHDCPIDCSTDAFGAWSTCTKSCGTGSQKRSRTQTEPTVGGKACPHYAETRDCNTHACPVDCVYAAFASNAWSDCTASCGTGVEKRSRTIAAPSHGGKLCPHSAETRTCNEQVCPTAQHWAKIDGASPNGSEVCSHTKCEEKCTRTSSQSTTCRTYVMDWHKMDQTPDHHCIGDVVSHACRCYCGTMGSSKLSKFWLDSGAEHAKPARTLSLTSPIPGTN